MDRRKRNSVADVLDRVTETPNGCWIWRGAKTSGGYGVVSFGNRMWRVHRLVYEKTVGPAGPSLDHVCRQRLCCNPAHLRPVTGRENVLAPGSLAPTKANAEKPTCPRCGSGYERQGNGRRFCRSCRNAVTRRYRAKRRATVKALRDEE